jgi:outer membrane protein assembly factor BamA
VNRHLNSGALFLCLILYYGLINTSVAQSSKTDTIPQKDIGNYIREITGIRIKAVNDTSYKKSKGPFTTVLPYPGYSSVSGVFFGVTNNISFYTLRTDSAKMSVILVSDQYSQNNQLVNVINSNIWTNDNKFNLIGDYSYSIFPTNTFGLGGTTLLSDATGIDYDHLRFDEAIMRKISNNLYIGGGYNLDYYWNIKETKNNPNQITDFDKYGYTPKSTASGFTLNAEYDNRLNSNNPVNGSFVNLQIRDNTTILGSDNNWKSLVLDVRHYFKLSDKSDNTLAIWSYDWLTIDGLPPYLDLPSNGEDAYNNTARGYVQGRYRGWEFIYAEAEYRFRILNNGFLGGVAFCNASSFPEYPSHKITNIDPATGVGLRIKMNKKSNVNLCMDYAIGIGGSKSFIFNLREVF